MPKFKGHYEETFTVDAPLEQTRSHFASFDTIVKSYVGLQRFEKLDEQTLRFELEPRSALGATFVGNYNCRYQLGDNVLTWRTVGSEGNIFTEGKAEFAPAGENRTRVSFRETMECDIPINRFLAKAVAPIVQRELSQGVKTYLEHIRDTLEP